ncbi:CRISPR-associated autoregulator DevR family [Arcobacter nitrofigilis DSM 7299]|uniref:CRISPR-associated autoregulator DevR family n=1 Tax=Arcobacter nitrofigilis (strain ATCC 33309 / DSM 7299 / CCUG 15893 / LMG 7604 / NCTC 12251 / CI) TaxID=572480 RepID=D5V721_ARCNC|nr:type I-B CRISPR-associated protein Cas7/Cst2/DevR [Arcobacter nitrofigilis]ADG94441.1 CRISPR-associated autoregulator DevR family [Arcobacter nitrofigilis DSM 7299]
MFLNIAYITKVNLASLNGSEGTGGNITEMKKIASANGEEYAYVSGQALRRYFKETLLQLGQRITEVSENGNPTFRDENGKYIDLDKKLKDVKELAYKKFIDLDLFGYMFPNGGRRWSPVKVTPLISILPYKGEYDYLTRKQKPKKENEKSGNIVQIEIDTLNFMRGNIMVNTSHIGNEIDEYTYDVNEILDNEEKNSRLNIFLDAIKNFNGGAKQSRNLEDISPKFIVIAKQKTGNPFLLNSLDVDIEGNINIENIKESIEDTDVESLTIGISKGIFKNEEEIKNSFENVVSVAKAIEEYKDILKSK